MPIDLYNSADLPGSAEAAREADEIVPCIEYYQRAFYHLHDELRKNPLLPRDHHNLRDFHWCTVAPGLYEKGEAREQLQAYLRVVDQELSSLLRGFSIGYWLHLCRRIAPLAIGPSEGPVTVMITRACLEAAVQKYAQMDSCKHIAFSNQVHLEQILSGLLTKSDYEIERTLVEQSAQLVLTDFTVASLRTFYEAERLAYEAWRTGAQLRTVGKGGQIAVMLAGEKALTICSKELNNLLEIYDKRNLAVGGGGRSMTGTVYDEESKGGGKILLPVYNVWQENFGVVADWLRSVFNLEFDPTAKPNLLWVPFQLREYYHAHQPFSKAFLQNRGVSLEAILCTYAAVVDFAVALWHQSDHMFLVRHWQRGYEGPWPRSEIVKEILARRSDSLAVLALSDDAVTDDQLVCAINHLALSQERRSDIGLVFPGPHSVFLPFGEDRWFIDFAWIQRSLQMLFYGIKVEDQNFKGDALEQLVRESNSPLPSAPCKATDGTSKQIDASFRIGDVLLIVECRAKGRSVGWETGDLEAVRQRVGFVNKALRDIDLKAQWLRDHPTGRNYDISWCTRILPIAVTPFVEFMPSSSRYYWIWEGAPRVISPSELKVLLGQGSLPQQVWNGVSMS